MVGIVVAGAEGVRGPASAHYAGQLTSVSPRLQAFVSAFVDGALVRPTDELDIVLLARSEGWVEVAVVEFEDADGPRCFVINIWARPASALGGLPAWARKGSPSVPEDFIVGDGVWQLYNCKLSLEPAHRDEVLARSSG